MFCLDPVPEFMDFSHLGLVPMLVVNTTTNKNGSIFVGPSREGPKPSVQEAHLQKVRELFNQLGAGEAGIEVCAPGSIDRVVFFLPRVGARKLDAWSVAVGADGNLGPSLSELRFGLERDFVGLRTRKSGTWSLLLTL